MISDRNVLCTVLIENYDIIDGGSSSIDDIQVWLRELMSASILLTSERLRLEVPTGREKSLDEDDDRGVSLTQLWSSSADWTIENQCVIVYLEILIILLTSPLSTYSFMYLLGSCQLFILVTLIWRQGNWFNVSTGKFKYWSDDRESECNCSLGPSDEGFQEVFQRFSVDIFRIRSL